MSAPAAAPAPAPIPSALGVGDRVTAYHYTDRTVWDVVAVKSHGRCLELRLCKATLLNGPRSGAPDALTVTPGGFAAHWSGTQRWDVQSDPNGETRTVTWREKARAFVTVGQSTKGGTAFRPGSRWYHDYNF